MSQSITLTASMRSNLASLKTIQGQMDTTQTRLSTGKKVNSAIDNASSFYQSRALTNRAADLDALLDSMGQGIQTIQAANQGIEAVTSYIEQAKSVANSAFALDPTAADYPTQVANYQTQFNAIIDEIGTLASDASYQGINLLTGGKLTVMFNETRTHKLDVQGDTITNEMSALGFDKATGATAWTAAATWEASATGQYYQTTATTANPGTGTTPSTASAYTTQAAVDPTDVENRYNWVETSTGSGVYHFVQNNSGSWYKITVTELDGSTREAYAQGISVNRYDLSNAAFKINKMLDSIAKSMDYLRDYASELGNNFSIIETRQNFTENLIDVLETGSDNLVLADMNEESANYLALQTRQQLAINSLALASQSAQSVLKLF